MDESASGDGTDGDTNPSIDAVRRATTAGVLDAVGTVWLLVLSLVFLAAGSRGLLVASTAPGYALSIGIVAGSVALALYAFDVVP
ncbi:hypothetical protein [Halovivax cerinus]|uniref:Uncharacterized protein n=1 Tax=Halovivax cerinus TaxID=1487865 RepID=A0ABD5NND2_9EURY|nr:hypothetical protein [Halovivax cerinus]